MIDCFAGSRPTPSRRSILPFVPKLGIGLPVVPSSAYTKCCTAAKTRCSLPSVQYATPRFGPRPSRPESNRQRGFPEAASNATHVMVRRNGKEDTVSNEWLRLGSARPLPAIIRPGDLKMGDVRAVYLRQTRIADSVRASPVAGPLRLALQRLSHHRVLCRDMGTRKQQ